MSEDLIIKINIFTPRWGHDDVYTFRFRSDQLLVSNGTKEASCSQEVGQDPKWSGYNEIVGNSLKNIFTNDSIYPPTVFIDAVEHAWIAWKNSEIDNENLELELRTLCEWLNTTTKAKPNSDFWSKIF